MVYRNKRKDEEKKKQDDEQAKQAEQREEEFRRYLEYTRVNEADAERARNYAEAKDKTSDAEHDRDEEYER